MQFLKLQIYIYASYTIMQFGIVNKSKEIYLIHDRKSLSQITMNGDQVYPSWCQTNKCSTAFKQC